MNREQRRVLFKDVKRKVNFKNIQCTFKEQDMELDRSMTITEGIREYDLRWILCSHFFNSRDYTFVHSFIQNLAEVVIPKQLNALKEHLGIDWISQPESDELLLIPIHHILNLDTPNYSGIEYFKPKSGPCMDSSLFSSVKLATFLTIIEVENYATLLHSGDSEAKNAISKMEDGLAAIANLILCDCKILKQFGDGFFGESQLTEPTTIKDVIQTIRAWWVLRNEKARKVADFPECQESLLATLETQFPSEEGQKCVNLVLNLLSKRNLKGVDVPIQHFIQHLYKYYFDTDEEQTLSNKLFLHLAFGDQRIIMEYVLQIIEHAEDSVKLANLKKQLVDLVEEQKDKVKNDISTSDKIQFLEMEYKKAKEKVKALSQLVIDLQNDVHSQEEIKRLKTEKQVLHKQQKAKDKEVQKLLARNESLELKLEERDRQIEELEKQLREEKVLQMGSPLVCEQEDTEIPLPEIIEYLKPLRIVVIGGIAGFKDRLQKILPNCRVFTYEEVGRVPQTKGADLVCVYTRAVHHPDRWAVDNQVAASGQPYCYINNSNLDMSLREMYETLQKSLAN